MNDVSTLPYRNGFAFVTVIRLEKFRRKLSSVSGQKYHLRIPQVLLLHLLSKYRNVYCISLLDNYSISTQNTIFHTVQFFQVSFGCASDKMTSDNYSSITWFLKCKTHFHKKVSGACCNSCSSQANNFTKLRLTTSDHATFVVQISDRGWSGESSRSIKMWSPARCTTLPFRAESREQLMDCFLCYKCFVFNWTVFNWSWLFDKLLRFIFVTPQTHQFWTSFSEI